MDSSIVALLAAAQHREQRRPAMRRLHEMVGVGAGDRQPDAAALGEAPGDRQQGETQELRLADRHRAGILAREAAPRPGRAVVARRRRLGAMDGAQHALGDVARRAVGLDLREIDEHRRIGLARGEPQRHDGMAGDLQRGLERRRGEAQRASRSRSGQSA